MPAETFDAPTIVLAERAPDLFRPGA